MNTVTYPTAAGREAPATREAMTTRVPLVRRVSWGAIFAGVVIAMALHMVLSLLGAGLGLSTIDPLKHSTPDAATFGLAAGLWWVVSSALALFVGGWIAAHLAGAADKTDASLHGLLTWGLATVVTAYILASMVGAVASGTGNLLGTAATAGASSAPVAEAMRRRTPSDMSVESLKDQAQQRLAQAVNPSAVPADPSTPLTEEQRQQADAKARQIADQAARRGSQMALALLLALVVGAIASTFGGSLGGRTYWLPEANRR
ncbi:hypothetical protein [Variovorax sp. LT1R16]|uniref:hypothetical protein n=1 Tax=Variovorax sp. LT1R16 TaxID=3443728 RepID=UPI003F44B6AB